MCRLSFLIVLLFTNIICFAGNVRHFYVNAFSNVEKSDGSINAPFKSLNELGKIQFRAGDCIYLAGNQILNGSIHIKDLKSTAEQPLIITSYGEGVSYIYSGNESAVLIESCENVCVKNITVKGSGRKAGNMGSGVEGINSRFVEVDKVEASGYLMNGIGFTGGGDIRITNSYAHDNGYNGIEITGEWGSKSVHNVYIGYCVAENNAGCPAILDNHSGSGILVGHATNTTIEFCEAMNNGWDMPRMGNGPVGIWGYESDKLTIQYCYSHNNKTSSRGIDGGGFDFDGGITNSVMQYNLSMNNEGSGYGLFQFGGATEWSGNVISHNVSVDDGFKNSQSGIYVWCDPYNKDKHLCETKISDNLIISGFGHAISFNTGYSTNLEFVDNIFVLKDESTDFLDGDETKSQAIFKRNQYWSEVAEKQGKVQPQVKEESNAHFEKKNYVIPTKVDVLKLKEIISNLLE